MKKLVPKRPGSALAITMIMAFLLAAISGALLAMTTTNRRVTDGHYTYHAMLPLGEQGIDQALKAINRYVKDNPRIWSQPGLNPNSIVNKAAWTTDQWIGDPLSAAGVHKIFPAVNLGDGRTAVLKVKVLNIPQAQVAPTIPYAIAEVSFSSASFLLSAAYTRQFIATFGADSGGGTGVVAIKTLNFKGNNVYADSYDSKYPYGATISTDPKYNNINKSDLVTVATPNTDAGAMNLGSANVFGFVATTDTGGSSPLVAWGPNAHVWGAVPTGTPYKYAANGVDTDVMGRVLNNFNLTVPDFPADQTVANVLNRLTPTATTWLSWNPTPATPLPPVDNLLKTNVINAAVGTQTLRGAGVAGAPVGGIYYLDKSISVDALTITGDVTIIVINPTVGSPPASAFATSAAVPSITASGGGRIIVAPGASLNVITAGTVSVTGIGGWEIQGATPVPNAVLISATNPTPGAQNITIAGNGDFIGKIYAPLAALKLAGGGSKGALFGSIIGYTVDANGVVNFHYDVNLRSLLSPSYALAALMELTGGNKIAFPSS